MSQSLNGQLHQDDELILAMVKDFRDSRSWGELTFYFKDGVLVSGSEKKTFKAVTLDTVIRM